VLTYARDVKGNESFGTVTSPAYPIPDGSTSLKTLNPNYRYVFNGGTCTIYPKDATVNKIALQNAYLTASSIYVAMRDGHASFVAQAVSAFIAKTSSISKLAGEIISIDTAMPLT